MLLPLKRGVERLLLGVISAMLTVMVCLMLWQVFTRYVLATPALFTEESLRFLMIWMALLGTAYCFATRKHLSLELLPALSPPHVQRGLAVINALISIGFATMTMFFGGLQASQSAMQQFSPIMQLPVGLIYMVLPISAALIVLFQVIDIILILQRKIPPLNMQSEGV
ncbi:hypothetical protein BFP70_03495 [Thioclava sp. SK-1]|uniref:TRAP transporter small permease n=1 Tax=Thioclava sp. SK-1 TaxID=1889770 RepID=UPI000825AEDE|nr:TRAP transporter small permease [Thioclava sp. SK-1]OCX66903.1 hypothetical protein BFP70_03495 [Thioclava sp. SK-1]